MTVLEYNKCVECFSDNLYRFALKSLRDDDEAKDIVQESFLRLWERREDVITGKEKSYLFTIGHHLIVDKVRFGKRYTTEESLQKIDYSLNRTYNNLNEILERHIRELPEIQQSVIMLRDYEGYSYAEIAEITSLSEAQVKINIFRARQALKKRIGNINNIL